MSDTLKIYGNTYTGITSIKAADPSGNELVYIRPQGTKSITENGTGIDVTDYAAVNVSVSGGGGAPALQSKSDIAPTESSQTITYDSGYDGLSSVQINAIPSTYVGSGITARSSSDMTFGLYGGLQPYVSAPSGYYEFDGRYPITRGTEGTPTATKGTVSNYSVSITPSVTNSSGYIGGGAHTGTAVTVSASELVSGTKSISANGTGIDVTTYATVDVAVPASTPNLQAKTNITPTESSQTITADSGYDGLSSVQINAVSSNYVGSDIPWRDSSAISFTSDGTVIANRGYYDTAVSKTMPLGTAGTPTATKGTVSNHSVSVTPSVTNTTGYIIGSTKTGTAVTVSASELVSGSATQSSNGTYDVTNLSSLIVAVPIVTYYTGSSAPSASLGSNGDIYLQTS